MTLGNEFLLVQRWPLKMKGKMGEPWSWVDYFIFFFFSKFSQLVFGLFRRQRLHEMKRDRCADCTRGWLLKANRSAIWLSLFRTHFFFFFFFFPDKEMIGKIRKQVLMSENVSFFFQLTDSWVAWLVRTNTPLESNCQLTFWYRTKKLSRHLSIIFGLFLPPLMRPPALLYFFPLLLTR